MNLEIVLAFVVFVHCNISTEAESGVKKSDKMKRNSEFVTSERNLNLMNNINKQLTREIY